MPPKPRPKPSPLDAQTDEQWRRTLHGAYQRGRSGGRSPVDDYRPWKDTPRGRQLYDAWQTGWRERQDEDKRKGLGLSPPWKQDEALRERRRL